MWPTVDGPRALQGAEGALMRLAVTEVMQHLVDELRHQSPQRLYGIDWFDQWDCGQRLWLLEQVTVGLMTDAAPLPAAAIWEATVDSIFVEVVDAIECELSDGFRCADDCSWRQRVRDAFHSQHGNYPNIEVDQTDIDRWRIVVTQITDAILGVPIYLRAESFRDGDIRISDRFLQQKGLPSDFLQRIPPVRADAQANASIDAIAAITRV